MHSPKLLVAAAVMLAGLPLLAQQTVPPPSPAGQSSASPSNPTAQQARPTGATAPAQVLSPVSVELVKRLDSKTAKSGDDVVVKTRSTVKTADGTEIPKGSKLVGHIVAVTPSGSGSNSQVILDFDQVQMKGGQTLAIHSQIESISPAGAEASGAMASAAAPAPASGAPMSTPQATGTMNSAAGTGHAGVGGVSQPTPQPPPADSSAAAPAAPAYPAAGTVVARNGNISIATTSIPGVLLANNAPGEQDPRMAKASSILLGNKRDIQLDGGTQMVVGLAASGAGQ